MMDYDVIIVGGGAAGMFAAAVCGDFEPDCRVLVLEKGPVPLAKVRISGGGRCNLTHACHDLRGFMQHYPRGANELLGPFHHFGPAETVDWFESHGVPLTTLEDGCLFPQSDTSADVIDALLRTAGQGDVEIHTHAEVTSLQPLPTDDAATAAFTVALRSGDTFTAPKVLLATGGGAFIDGLDHTIEPCVPSLFTFNTADPQFTALAGIVVEEIAISGEGIDSLGTLLITHTGVSGPGVLSFSAAGARPLAACDYQFDMTINWCPQQREEALFETLSEARTKSPRKQVATWSPLGLQGRLWRLLVERAALPAGQEWASCSNKSLRAIVAQVRSFSLPVTGKNRHREEFVTCGGISLKEVDFTTMQSRLHPGLYLAGEVLDIDAVTGGFNLQAAWTTGYLAALQLLD